MIVLVLFLAVGLLLWLVRGRAGAAPGAAAAESTTVVASRPASPASPTTTRAPSGPAAAALARLVVATRFTSAGYARSQFGLGWLDPDGNGCDAREDVLRRDLADLQVRPGSNGCIAERGVLLDPYTGQRLRFERGPTTSGEVEIDHVVSLSNAWRTGAAGWSPQRREVFANDPLNLLAVARQTNDDKAFWDAAAWLPPRPELRCAFVARQIAVKQRYALQVSRRERDAMAAVLATCPGQRVPA